ncbi:MAG: glycosyltransferase family 2 protein [Pseudomonadota bacterium]
MSSSDETTQVDAPDVTVAIPTYNSGATVADTMRSVFAQTGCTFEIVVADDGSADNSIHVVKQTADGDPRVRIVEVGPSKPGPSTARNTAMKLARGRYIATADADDLMTPDRLATLVAYGDETGADVVADNILRRFIDEDPVREVVLFEPEALRARPKISLLALVDPNMKDHYGAPVGYLKPLIRTDSWRRLGVRYDENVSVADDHYFLAELLARGADIRVTDHVGYIYMTHSGSHSYRITPEKFINGLDAEDRFMARHAGEFDAETLAACRRRRDWLLRMGRLENIVYALKARKPIEALSHGLGAPAAWPYLATRFSAIGANKLRAAYSRAARAI